jgi:DNA gyrase/topoisomerase IV subunit B
MLWEVIANCVDQYLAAAAIAWRWYWSGTGAFQFATMRGIPLDRDESGKRFAERVLTELQSHATRDGHHPHVHVGMLGVGLAVVNA